MSTSTLIGPEPDQELIDRMHALYKHLHAHPELSMQEHRTAELISTRLSALGIDNFRCGGTGVVGVMRNGPGPIIAFRADIDGLPIKEDAGLDYASTDTALMPDGITVPVMHGCGHDAHITVLLTTAELLKQNPDIWSGSLVLIFQPGEETAAGANEMIQDGLWQKAPQPEVILGHHVMPHEAGTIQITSGTAMATADSWKVTVHGRQAHGSQPHAAIDPIVLAAHMISLSSLTKTVEAPPRAMEQVAAGTPAPFDANAT